MNEHSPPTLLVELLEGYVLAAIGHLTQDDHERYAVTSRRLFGGSQDWRAGVRRAIGIGVELDASLQKLWEDNADVARDEGTASLSPSDFARMVVDENFRPLLGDQAGP